MLTTLVKLAYELDTKGEFEMADKIDAAVKSLAERVGLKLEDLVSLADHFDSIGETTIANQIDDMIKEAAKKKEKSEKKFKRPKNAPKAWVMKMLKKMMKEDPDCKPKECKKMVMDLYAKMSDKQVEKLVAKYK